VRVLVTGGSGFIGSHVVDQLLAREHEPVVLDTTPSPHHPWVTAVIGDLTHPETVLGAARDMDAIVHLAAVADVNDVFADPVRAGSVNVHGTQMVLEAARHESIGRVVYASTVWVYGNAPVDGDLDEDAPLAHPSHVYTATKLAGEIYCNAYGELYGVESTILRFGIPYGPRARPAAVVPSFVTRAKQGDALTIAGDGNQTRQFVYVEDLAEGVVLALEQAPAQRVYNLVGDEETSVRQIADTVRSVVGDVPVVHGSERPADVRLGHISGARAAAELSWTATTNFADGVRRYVDWLSIADRLPVHAARG
jgi:UDP-glucose 4-epimerase